MNKAKSETDLPSLADLTHAEGADIADVTNPSGTTQNRSIELGGFHLVDEFNSPLVAGRPKPRGLLPVPPEVEAAVAEDDYRS